jgi:predicted nucleic acid-binding protein
MTGIGDSTVMLHLVHHRAKMKAIIKEAGITSLLITRVSYLELLAGASENAKMSTKKMLQEFLVVEFDKKAAEIGNSLAMKHRVGTKSSKDFLIACIAISNNLPLLTENDKDFPYKKLRLLPYRISKV